LKQLAERPPVVEPLDPIVLASGSRLCGEMNYYEYGVVSIKMELPFDTDWPKLVDLASRWMATSESEVHAEHTIRRHLDRVRATLRSRWGNSNRCECHDGERRREIDRYLKGLATRESLSTV